MAKAFRAFRFPPELYSRFKTLSSNSGYTVTGAFEKFMTVCVENGSLVFPEAGKVEDVEREARIMLAWLRKGSYWITRGGRHVSVPVALLELLPKIHDAELKKQIEEELKKH